MPRVRRARQSVGSKASGRSKRDTNGRRVTATERRTATLRDVVVVRSLHTLLASMPVAAGEHDDAPRRLGSQEGDPPTLSQSDSTRDLARFTRPLGLCLSFPRPELPSYSRVHPRPLLTIVVRIGTASLTSATDGVAGEKPFGSSHYRPTDKSLTRFWISNFVCYPGGTGKGRSSYWDLE